MKLEKLKNQIKEDFSKQIVITANNKAHKINQKQLSLFSGLLAFGILVNSAISIETKTYISIFGILYAFLILLPISYYQMIAWERAQKYT